MGNLVGSNQHGKYINTKEIMNVDFNINLEKLDDMIANITESKSDDYDKINALLKIDCTIYTGLGTDSTKEEKEDAKKASKKIMKAISKMDDVLGKSLSVGLDD